MKPQGSQQLCASKFVNVLGSRMHYLEAGQGEDTILFLHGMPTSSYLWRNIIPHLADKARCIAPDLIGMGHSDKPDIEYRIFDHIRYINEFIKCLDLKHITLVLHGWGGVIGLDYASQHESNIKAIALYETHLFPVKNKHQLSLPVQQLASLLQRPGASYRAVVKQNYLINKLLPSAVIRNLTTQELDEYRKPFPTPESRKPLWQYIQDLPLGEGPEDVIALIEKYSLWLQQTNIPKLLFYAIPGFMATMEEVRRAKEQFKNLQLVSLEDVLHFAQESTPELFSQELRKWYLGLTIKEKV